MFQLILFLLILLCSLNANLAQTNTYKAAVVEYAPQLQGSTPENILLENTQEYINFIEQAAEQNVNIIVFPEDGLTGWKNVNHDTVEQMSTEVPDPSSQISPCITRDSNYSKSFIDLSCAAQTSKVYTAVNLIEKEYDSKTNKKIYHNTNVVFDKNGGVIARYRKTNLFNEPVFEPGVKPVTFKTDFGVTFGMFICFDISFKNPALDVLLDASVTDIIYSVAWFSEVPFWSALSTQHGYAKSNGVNLLSSGLNEPESKNGGSGIFLADGTVTEMYISGKRASRLIIQNVPKISSRYDSCQAQSLLEQVEQVNGGDVNSFSTFQEKMTNYTFKSLNLNNKIITETICSGNKHCCTFNITISKNSTSQPNYAYKLAIFYGVRQASLTKTVGIQNCGIVACLNESTTSCGLRNTVPPTGITFESISVKGTFDLKDAHVQPVTLKFDLKPVIQYTHCSKAINNNTVEVNVATTASQDALLTFGIHGRVFSNDYKAVGPINNSGTSLND